MLTEGWEKEKKHSSLLSCHSFNPYQQWLSKNHCHIIFRPIVRWKKRRGVKRQGGALGEPKKKKKKPFK